MILDTNVQFVNSADDVATEAGTSLVGDVVDLGAAGQDPGNGQPVYLVIQVITAFDGGAGTNGTTQFVLASDAIEALAADNTESRHILTKAFAASELAAGAQYVYPLPTGGSEPYERYLGIEVIQATEGEDDGAINAFLTLDPAGWKSYPDAVN
jgi:hypothetical protein|tara:strand:- start:994 stop:1455 length:462 start_codon:yes stop_codon:yes gene_type:complete